MSTNRRPVALVRNPVISEGQLDLWKRLKAIAAFNLDVEMEPKGRRGEFLSGLAQFEYLMGGIEGDPATYPAIYAASPTPPSYMSAEQISDYNRAHQIFAVFEQLVAEADARV